MGNTTLCSKNATLCGTISIVVVKSMGNTLSNVTHCGIKSHFIVKNYILWQLCSKILIFVIV